MVEYSSSPYVTWIKHLSDYPQNAKVVVASEQQFEILVHPGHQSMIIPSLGNIYEVIDQEDKTLQLYFYSLGWVIPVLSGGDKQEISAALKVVESVLDITPDEERSGAWNMLWDDHAICERLCVLLELKELLVVSSVLGEAVIQKIDDHVKAIIRYLAEILDNEKWKNNNHRVFHLLAAFIYAHATTDEEGKNKFRGQIEGFINELIDQETGFSLEQSIAYCFFDLVIVKNIIETMSGLSAGLNVDAELIENNLNSHIAAISFPDGSMPASGDSAHGRMLSSYQKKFMPENSALAEHWRRLDKIGYYRGGANDDSVHFLTLSHNAESAHGHASPLHTDIWFADFGFLMVDAGGPYKYGSKIRYQWYRAARGHNSLSLTASNQQELKKLSIDVDYNRSGLRGEAEFKSSSHSRSIFAYSNELYIHEAVTADEEWEVYYNFAEGVEITLLQKGSYEITKHGSIGRLILTTNINSSSLKIQHTERCVGHSKSVLAPSLIVSSDAEIIDWNITIKSV
ncbi:heparinase II/III family protein [Halomonas sp. N3-2A]|uniref:heparinase II/III family protein n=1 Tax=Halomonas sp. N3-2A TaxID=2014541 RepID=UPI000B5B4733|nr:heparinase II/III family protein [Halomonas sp. N3-2A]ASK18000.1 hypothetical protein CEK60_01200 [Halomonas sp. N3-2A]